MDTLPDDTARCAARFDFKKNGHWCKERHTCQRYLALTQWDMMAGVPHYGGIPVTMGRRDCGIKIKTVEMD